MAKAFFNILAGLCGNLAVKKPERARLNWNPDDGSTMSSRETEETSFFNPPPRAPDGMMETFLGEEKSFYGRSAIKHFHWKGEKRENLCLCLSHPRPHTMNIFNLLFLRLSDPPLVNIQLGSTLSSDDIKEGDDLYLECHIQANPRIKKLSWLHNVSITKFPLLLRLYCDEL